MIQAPSFSRFFPKRNVFWAIVGCATVLANNLKADDFPAENPPVESSVETQTPKDDRVFVPLATPSVEWTFHKTEDGSHPSGLEQAMVWLTNRARTDPEAEGIFLGSLTAPNILSQYNGFGVDLQKMMAEFAALEPRPPIAFDARIWDASRLHSEFMIADNRQSHDGQFARVDASDFKKNGGAASVFWRAQDPVHGHAALNVDWGGGTPDGMQTGRGHRQAIMGNPHRPNFGLAIVEDNDPQTQAGPLVTSIAYAAAQTIYPDHFNKFIVGTVWEDVNSNGLYDDGEGISGVTVTPDIGTYFAVTGDAGGFTIPVTADDDYVVSFSGGDLAEPEVRLVTVAGESALVIWNEEDSYVAAPLGPPTRPDFRITRNLGGISVEWTALPDHTYTFQAGTDLTGWFEPTQTIEEDGATRRLTITRTEAESDLFFRLRVERGAP